MNRDLLTKSTVFFALVALAVLVRLISSTPNFAPVAATALFAGFYFRHRTTAICVPLLAMMISDYFLGGYAKLVMISVYGSFLLPVAWRSILRAKLSPLRVGLGAVSSSVAFFVFTNAAVWYSWYPHTLAGLTRCYTTAVPFFAYTLASDVLFAAGFFSLYTLAVRLSAVRVAVPAAA